MWPGLVAVASALVLGAIWWLLRRRHLDRWIGSYIADTPRRGPPKLADEVHVFLCIADHFEPKWGRAEPGLAAERVERWVREFPKVLGAFHDSDGRPPRHTFFYPEEEYEPEYIDGLSELVACGLGEVEVHLHHDNDTAAGLRDKLTSFAKRLSERHGLLGRSRKTGDVAYGFVHGNWALNNSRPDGRWCGINDEIAVLHETGCYADFTMPSAPSPTQTRTVNRIYYAKGNPTRPRGHDRGVEIGSGPAPVGALLLIQGPLVLDWGRRKWGLVPRIENGCLQASQPPTMARLGLWLSAQIRVPGRLDWFFVKLHTHGATESNRQVLLGEPMKRFHEGLALQAEKNHRFRYHYVTAREMYNLARAAEAGWRRTVDEARDFEIAPPERLK